MVEPYFTKEVKEISERIIQDAQQCGGQMLTNMMGHYYNSIDMKRLVFHFLIENEFIKLTENNTVLCLTKRGFEFESFAQIDLDRIYDEEQKYLEREKLKREVFRLKYFWWIIVGTIIATVVIEKLVDYFLY